MAKKHHAKRNQQHSNNGYADDRGRSRNRPRNKSRANSNVVEIVIRDTVYVEKQRAESSSVVLDNPCDSVTGLLRKFEVQAGKTKVVSDGNSISVNTECEELLRYYQSESKEVSRYIKQLEHEKDSLLMIINKKESTSYMAEIKETSPFWHRGKLWALGGLLIVSFLLWLIWKFWK